MGVVVNTNISSITASRILSENRADLEKSMERLASGKRINSAADDAAGMAVAAKMRADIGSLNQAVRNTNDAISLVNTYDGAAQEIESILIRMRELAVQAKNGTYESADRTNADYEYTALKEEIKRIADVTAFNRRDIGTSAAAAGGKAGRRFATPSPTAAPGPDGAPPPADGRAGSAASERPGSRAPPPAAAGQDPPRTPGGCGTDGRSAG